MVNTAYPDLGDWGGKQPVEIEPEAQDVAELLAWSAVEDLTGHRVAFRTTTIRPMIIEGDGTVRLPSPCGGVDEVRIDGVVFMPWRVDNGTSLIRLDDQAWPSGQDISIVSGVGVFEIDYWAGLKAGRLLTWAAGQLAAEFYRAAAGDKKCRLPSNVTAVTRQGVSFEMQAPLFADGRTGIDEIDVILARYNPARSSGQTIVATPETLARYRRMA